MSKLPKIQIETKVVSSFMQNARLIREIDSGQCVLLDPGSVDSEIESWITNSANKICAVWLTHSHLDHCGGVAEVLRKLHVPLYGHSVEKIFRERVEEIAKSYGIPDRMENCPEPTIALSGGDTVYVGTVPFRVLFTPGHSPGHVCFYCEEEKLLLSGDTVFAGGIGRTDLPGGNHPQLLDSIQREILSLPADVVVLPGHGPSTSVGKERTSNPFLS